MPNKPDAVNPAMALRLTIDSHWRRVTGALALRHHTPMASLDDFLNARDLDDLLKVRSQMGELTPEEIKRITDLLHDWRDGQAVSNLLFYPLLIPAPMRWDCIDRAFASTEKPYFALAAVLGLQSVDPETVPSDVRTRWVTKLLEIVRSDGEVLSSRASVTIWPWLRNGEAEEFVRVYCDANSNVTSLARRV